MPDFNTSLTMILVVIANLMQAFWPDQGRQRLALA
ncbi:MAG: hypothetical protein ACI82N_000761 [Maricaulis sp.]|jgi:hypothetical protein